MVKVIFLGAGHVVAEPGPKDQLQLAAFARGGPGDRRNLQFFVGTAARDGHDTGQFLVIDAFLRGAGWSDGVMHDKRHGKIPRPAQADDRNATGGHVLGGNGDLQAVLFGRRAGNDRGAAVFVGVIHNCGLQIGSHCQMNPSQQGAVVRGLKLEANVAVPALAERTRRRRLGMGAAAAAQKSAGPDFSNRTAVLSLNGLAPVTRPPEEL